jgi:hypothetical protein
VKPWWVYADCQRNLFVLEATLCSTSLQMSLNTAALFSISKHWGWRWSLGFLPYKSSQIWWVQLPTCSPMVTTSKCLKKTWLAWFGGKLNWFVSFPFLPPFFFPTGNLRLQLLLEETKACRSMVSVSEQLTPTRWVLGTQKWNSLQVQSLNVPDLVHALASGRTANIPQMDGFRLFLKDLFNLT